jgi:hypothetical protein
MGTVWRSAQHGIVVGAALGCVFLMASIHHWVDRGSTMGSVARASALGWTGAAACPPCRAPSPGPAAGRAAESGDAPAIHSVRRPAAHAAGDSPAVRDTATDCLAIAAMVLFLFGIGIAAGGGPSDSRPLPARRAERRREPRVSLRLKET